MLDVLGNRIRIAYFRLMLLVRTRVKPSAIHGMGLFAAEMIRKGTPIWRAMPGFDQEFPPDRVAQLPPMAQQHLRWFGFLDRDSGCFHLSGDHACFMNHASTPNTGASSGSNAPVTTLALRDIEDGEELTCDYFAFDAEAESKLGITGTPPG